MTCHDATLGAQRLDDLELVIVDMLTVGEPPRHDDGYVACVERIRDCPASPVANHHPRGTHSSEELGARNERRSLQRWYKGRSPVLNPNLFAARSGNVRESVHEPRERTPRPGDTNDHRRPPTYRAHGALMASSRHCT